LLHTLPARGALTGTPDTFHYTDYNHGCHDGTQQTLEQGRTGVGAGNDIRD